MTNQTTAIAPVQRLKSIISTESVQEQFKNALAENAGLFIASLIDIYSSDSYLQKCEPSGVIREALRAATLKLPINKGLGFAYIVPYKNQATMQIGYKGYIQLAQRTGQYRYINADIVYQGELVVCDRITGEVSITGEPTSDDAIGYFAYIETVNGFRKTIYWPKVRIIAHAKKYSASYGRDSSAWKTDFDEMAMKTVLRRLLSKYGVMSVDIIAALNSDHESDPSADAQAHANLEIIDVEHTVTDTTEKQNGKKNEPNNPGPDF